MTSCAASEGASSPVDERNWSEHPEDRIVDALVRTSFLVTAALSAVGTEHHLSLTQVRVLGILSDRQLRMTELAAYLGLERSTLSGLVNRAEQRGLLVRTRADSDGRSIEVSTTAEGRALAESVHGELAARLAPLVVKLDAEQRDCLAGLLESLPEPIESSGDSAPGAGRP
ncbi:MarR family winged helix-turn-helix transcriptional regulator [Propionibacterium sp.]|uniref:MarR family winged helix-turn-helix transcriptional regulator n=1 Tax=Propionibacterium sp. TaxID=1977903 RepID=UPI0039ED265F